MVFCTKLCIKLAVSLCSFSQFSFPFNFETANALVLKFSTLPLRCLFSNTLLAIFDIFFFFKSCSPFCTEKWAKNDTVKEEIFVGEKFRTFPSKTFRMEFNFVLSNGAYSSLFRAKASGGHSKARETRDAQLLQKVTRFALIGVGPARPRVCECPPPQIPVSQSPF